MRLKRVFTAVHKWLALVVGIQIGLWMLSGLVMAVLPIEQVRGEHNIAKRPQPLIKLDNLAIETVEQVVARMDAVSVTVTTIGNGFLMYELKTPSGETVLVDPHAGIVSPIQEPFARAVAVNDFAGDGRPVSTVLVTEEGGDYRGRLPAWRVQFDDDDNTRIYVAADDGRVTARRSDTWRLYDFFWMLHIMDYSDRENFNSPWMVAFAAGGLAVALSGLPLLWYALKPVVLGRRRRVA